MKGLSKREKTLIVIAVIALFFYFYYTLFLSPVMDDMQVSFGKIKGYKQSIKNENDKNDVNSKLKTERENVKNEYIKAMEQLPYIERNPEIVDNIRKFAAANEVEVVGINCGEPEEYVNETSAGTANSDGNAAGGSNNAGQGTANAAETRKLLRVPVGVNIETIDYNKAMEFLASMEKDRRFSEVNGVIVAAKESSGGAVPNGTLKTTIIAYYYYVDAPDGELPHYDFSVPPGSKADVFKN